MEILILGMYQMWLELETCSSASSFNQDISDWNVSSFGRMRLTFEGSNNLSDFNKGKFTKPSHQTRIRLYDVRIRPFDDSNFQTAVNLWFDTGDSHLRAHQRLEYLGDYGKRLKTRLSKDISAWMLV